MIHFRATPPTPERTEAERVILEAVDLTPDTHCVSCIGWERDPCAPYGFVVVVANDTTEERKIFVNADQWKRIAAAHERMRRRTR